jgi:hypothetical protein
MPQEQTATQQFTPQEFAAKIKTKYPVYASVPDDQLVEKITAKYPQYKTSIKFSPEAQKPDAVKQAQTAIASTPMKPSYTAMAFGAVPGGADPHNPGNPNLNALPPETRQDVSTSLAKTQAGVLAGQGAGALVGKAFAPTITSETVPTGIFNPAGKELVRDVMRSGPSAANKLLKTALPKIIKKALGSYGVYEVAKKLGVPLP